MKSIVLVLALTAIVNAQLPDYEKCAEETGSDLALINRVKKKDFNFEDDHVKAFFFCMFKKLKILGPEGEILKDVLLSYSVNDEEKVRVGQAIDICVSTVAIRDTPEEMSWSYAKCFNEQYPEHDYIKE